MSRLASGFAVAAILAGFAPAASAQAPASPGKSTEEVCTARAVTLRENAPGGAKPYAILWSSGALSHDCVIHAFMDASKPPPGESEPRIRILRFREEAGQQGTIRFYSADCAGAVPAARALETFQPRGVKLPALNPSNTLTLTADGAYLGLWTTQSRMQGRVGGNTLLAEGWNYPGLDAVDDAVRTALADCPPADPPYQ